jgi:hypothetical protein
MRGVPDRGVIHPQVVANATYHDEPGVESQAQLQCDPVLNAQLVTIAIDRFSDCQGGLHSPEGMVLQGHRGPKECHQPITQELIHRALIAMHGISHEPQDAVHDLVHGFRV